jgi:hypothetical protein
MPIYLEELMEVVRAHGLEGEDRKGWVQVPAGNAWSLPRRIYLKRPRERRPVSAIHLSGFSLVHPAVTPLSAEEARRRHLGLVRGEIHVGDHRDDEVLDAVEAALFQLSQIPAEQSVEAPTSLAQAGDVPGPELPDIPTQTIVEWMRGRLGYGNRAASGWFLGMEEACEDAMELPERVQGGDLEDLEAALTRFQRYPDLLTDAPTLQRTWAPLIRAWLVASSAKDIPPTTEAVRLYQRRHWGRSNGTTLLIELLPLPSPSLQDWPYAGLGLGTRAAHQREWLGPRIELLARLWRESSVKPRVAVAYGRSYWKHYRRVFALPEAGGEQISLDDPTWAEGYETDAGAVVLVRHPVAFGNSHDRWEALGRWLRRHLTPRGLVSGTRQ